MSRRPPRTTRTDTLFPYTTLFRSRVRELPLLADVGINPDEVGRRQPLVISVKLTLFGGGDRIDETIDYRRIASAAETLATTHIPLIETFARSLGAEYLAWPYSQSAHIMFDKPFALQLGVACVDVLKSTNMRES